MLVKCHQLLPTPLNNIWYRPYSHDRKTNNNTTDITTEQCVTVCNIGCSLGWAQCWDCWETSSHPALCRLHTEDTCSPSVDTHTHTHILNRQKTNSTVGLNVHACVCFFLVLCFVFEQSLWLGVYDYNQAVTLSFSCYVHKAAAAIYAHINTYDCFRESNSLLGQW